LAHDRQYEPLIPGYAWRHHALPGITGWAQVSGHRGETSAPGSMDARVAHDLWYIRNWSMWLDLKILLMTARAVLKSTNAY
jgi:lipopolysaccharide/colanic/teichoic acid biosynthesis glycosyltransferase